MRSLLAELDRVTLAALAVGLLLGALWLVDVRLGAPVAILGVAIGVILSLTRLRWLEAGVLIAATGLVPTVAYFLYGNPTVPPPATRPSIELLAPGAALILTVVGLLVVAWSAVDVARHGRGRRERQAARERRRQARLANRGT